MTIRLRLECCSLCSNFFSNAHWLSLWLIWHFFSWCNFPTVHFVVDIVHAIVIVQALEYNWEFQSFQKKLYYESMKLMILLRFVLLMIFILHLNSKISRGLDSFRFNIVHSQHILQFKRSFVENLSCSVIPSSALVLK